MTERIVIDPELWDLVPGYLERRRSDVERIGKAIARGAFDELDEIGHKLRGSGAAYGFQKISQIGRAFEATASAADLDAATRLLDELVAHLGDLEPVRG